MRPADHADQDATASAFCTVGTGGRILNVAHMIDERRQRDTATRYLLTVLDALADYREHLVGSIDLRARW